MTYSVLLSLTAVTGVLLLRIVSLQSRNVSRVCLSQARPTQNAPWITVMK